MIDYWDLVSREEYADFVAELDDHLFVPVDAERNCVMQVIDPDDPKSLIALATYYPKTEPIYRIKKGRRRVKFCTVPNK